MPALRPAGACRRQGFRNRRQMMLQNTAPTAFGCWLLVVLRSCLYGACAPHPVTFSGGQPNRAVRLVTPRLCPRPGQRPRPCAAAPSSVNGTGLLTGRFLRAAFALSGGCDADQLAPGFSFTTRPVGSARGAGAAWYGGSVPRALVAPMVAAPCRPLPPASCALRSPCGARHPPASTRVHGACCTALCAPYASLPAALSAVVLAPVCARADAVNATLAGLRAPAPSGLQPGPRSLSPARLWRGPTADARHWLVCSPGTHG